MSVQNLNSAETWKPKLNTTVQELNGILVLANELEEIEFSTNLPIEDVYAFLQGLDGKRSLADLSVGEGALASKNAEHIVKSLDKYGLIDNVEPREVRSGLDVLMEIEDLTNKILYDTLYKNIFWQRCKSAMHADDVPVNVMHGLVIENYHFLFRESYFDAPVLSYVGNTKARLAMNAFFAEENGHDELLLKSLNSIGLSREDLFGLCPLPETMALINALAYWAHNDPIFFFTTLGVLEGKDIKEDSFISAAERMNMPKSFIGPVKAHSNLNLDGEHGNLTRQIFSFIPAIDLETVKRLRAQTYLFIELYDAFFSAIWEHYSNTDDLRSRSLDRI